MEAREVTPTKGSQFRKGNLKTHRSTPNSHGTPSGRPKLRPRVGDDDDEALRAAESDISRAYDEKEDTSAHYLRGEGDQGIADGHDIAAVTVDRVLFSEASIDDPSVSPPVKLQMTCDEAFFLVMRGCFHQSLGSKIDRYVIFYYDNFLFSLFANTRQEAFVYCKVSAYTVLSFLDGEGDVTMGKAADASTQAETNFPRLNIRKSGAERWAYEIRATVRQRWYYKQRNALFKAMLRLKMTCGANSALLVVPETLNAAAFSTAGSFSEFIRAYSAVLAGLRRRKALSLRAPITEIWARFSGEVETNQTAVFDSLFDACESIVGASLLSRARATLDRDIAFAGSGSTLDPRSSRLSRLISTALENYIAEVDEAHDHNKCVQGSHMAAE
jgi:hypothetical protein